MIADILFLLKYMHCLCPAEAYEEPRLTCWYGELPYTYSHSTMAPNSQVLFCFVNFDYCLLSHFAQTILNTFFKSIIKVLTHCTFFSFSTYSGIPCSKLFEKQWSKPLAANSTRCCVTCTGTAMTALAGTVTMRPP